MIDFNNALSIWSVSWKGGDYLAAVQKSSDGRFDLILRIRDYKDDKPFESKDEKHWYSKSYDDRNFAMREGRDLYKEAKSHTAYFGAATWDLIRRPWETQSTFNARLMTKPNVHLASQTPADAA